MQFHRKRQALAIASCFLPCTAMAQTATPVPQLGNIVVTASRTTQPLKSVVGDVSVVSSEELQKAGQSSLVEIIGKQPGVQFTSSGGPQTLTSVFLRGTESRHTLVLIDGIRINGATYGGVQWQALDPATIERVEILRGAASSLYGSDAIGGVINIITKKNGADRPFAAWGNVGIGSYDTFKSSVGFSGAAEDWDYSLSSSMAESGGFSATNLNSDSYNRDSDGYTQRSLSGSLGYRWAAGQHVGLTAYNGYINGDYDSGSSMTSAHGISRQQAYTLTSTNEITQWWESVLRFGFSKESYESRGEFYGDSVSKTMQRSYLWQNNLQLSENHKVSTLFERNEERLQSTLAFTATRRTTNAMSLIYRGDFGPAHLQASARNDNVSDYGNKQTGSLALDFDLTPHWKIGVAGSTGFKAPTYQDMYTPSDWGMPNPDLKPEQSRNIEASLKYQNTTTSVGITAYQNKIRDLITWTPFFPGSFDGRAENINQATIRGVTLAASQKYGNTILRASADFMNPRNDTTGKQLVLRARQVYNLGVDHRVGLWTMGAEYQFTGKRYNNAANTSRLGGHSLLNLTAGYDFTKNVGVQLRWNNVLDKDYSNIYGYNTPGSNLFVNLSWRM